MPYETPRQKKSLFGAGTRSTLPHCASKSVGATAVTALRGMKSGQSDGILSASPLNDIYLA